MKSYSSATTIYSIQADDTIKTIAYKFQTTPQQLIKLNGNQPIFIQAKRQLIVPLPCHPNVHVVTEGESMKDLLIRFKLSPHELLSLNEDIFLQPGQLLVIQP